MHVHCQWSELRCHAMMAWCICLHNAGSLSCVKLKAVCACMHVQQFPVISATMSCDDSTMHLLAWCLQLSCCVELESSMRAMLPSLVLFHALSFPSVNSSVKRSWMCKCVCVCASDILCTCLCTRTSTTFGIIGCVLWGWLQDKLPLSKCAQLRRCRFQSCRCQSVINAAVKVWSTQSCCCQSVINSDTKLWTIPDCQVSV